MPVKIDLTTEESIIAVPLPVHGGRYAVIPHEVIINKVKSELAKEGFAITKVMYKSTISGNIAQGIYHLNYGTDKDMGLMFAWSNSYDKTQKFKCGIGTYVFVCGNGMLSGDMGNAVRKHTGTAKDDAFDFIESQIQNAAVHYDQLVKDKELYKSLILTAKEKGKIVGQLFVDQEILTLTQLGIIKREMDKPSHTYNADPDSAWCLYNNITAALKESHPTTWLDDHSKLHDLFVNEFGQLTKKVIINKPEEIILSNDHTDLFKYEDVQEKQPVFSSGLNSVVFS